MPFIPSLPILPLDPTERRRAYMRARRMLTRAESDCASNFRLGCFAVVIASASAAVALVELFYHAW